MHQEVDGGGHQGGARQDRPTVPAQWGGEQQDQVVAAAADVRHEGKDYDALICAALIRTVPVLQESATVSGIPTIVAISRAAPSRTERASICWGSSNPPPSPESAGA